MRRCLRCESSFVAQKWLCPSCGWEPVTQDGMPVMAPGLMKDDEQCYDPSWFSALADLEAGSFWFRGRNALLLWVLRKYGAGIRSFLEIGCGTGFVLQGVAQAFPETRIAAGDGRVEGLTFAAQRVPKAELLQLDARAIPFVDEFEALGAFDVIEHIEEDEAALEQMSQALAPGGLLILTVPQHTWLWSAVDEEAYHVRRYSFRDLRAKVKAQGLQPVYSTSFVSLLLPAMWLSRLLKRGERVQKEDIAPELELNPLLNKIFGWVMGVERALIRLGVRFPAGGSRLLVARKPISRPED